MNIKITPEYLEKISNNLLLTNLGKKSLGNKLSYRLARIFNALEKEMKIYFAEKQKIIEKYAERYDKDGQQKDKNGKVIKSWKKGDIISDGQTVALADIAGFNSAMQELLQTEVDLGMEKVRIDFENPKMDQLTVQEMQILLPLMEE